MARRQGVRITPSLALEIVGADTFLLQGHVTNKRITVFTFLFSRIVDLENLGVLLAALTSEELSEVQSRIGILNLLNVDKADKQYRLDLKEPDQRKVAAMLGALALAEGGIGPVWTNPVYTVKGGLHHTNVETDAGASAPGQTGPDTVLAGAEFIVFAGRWGREEKCIPHTGMLTFDYKSENPDVQARASTAVNTLIGKQLRTQAEYFMEDVSCSEEWGPEYFDEDCE